MDSSYVVYVCIDANSVHIKHYESSITACALILMTSHVYSSRRASRTVGIVISFEGVLALKRAGVSRRFEQYTLLVFRTNTQACGSYTTSVFSYDSLQKHFEERSRF